jgi:hypothetical protein
MQIFIAEDMGELEAAKIMLGGLLESGKLEDIIQPGQPPFYDQLFDAENHFVEGMTAIDLINHVYMVDGVNWIEIEYNHL